MNKLIDLTGQTFGLLLVVEKSHTVRSENQSQTFWKCQCSCGNIHVVDGRCLRDGITKSCGCYRETYKRSKTPKLVSAYAVYNHPRQHGRSVIMRYSEADITFEKFLELSQMPCHYCGCPPSNKVNKVPKGRNNYDDYWFTYNGLDRVDSSKPHTIENCVPCCRICNLAKSNMTSTQFLEWLERAYNHSFKSIEHSNRST